MDRTLKALGIALGVTLLMAVVGVVCAGIVVWTMSVFGPVGVGVVLFVAIFCTMFALAYDDLKKKAKQS